VTARKTIISYRKGRGRRVQVRSARSPKNTRRRPKPMWSNIFGTNWLFGGRRTRKKTGRPGWWLN
jgi:hypothetical protein